MTLWIVVGVVALIGCIGSAIGGFVSASRMYVDEATALKSHIKVLEETNAGLTETIKVLRHRLRTPSLSDDELDGLLQASTGNND